MLIEPTTLEGCFIRLEPLSILHVVGMCEVGLDVEIWRWMPQAVRTPEEMRAFVDAATIAQADGTALPFAVIDQASGQAIGSSRFFNIERAYRRVEIGWTWLGLKWQRTAANTEAKYLMLRHAFETWGCIRVEFKSDSLNDRSRAALLRIGAKEEGSLRNHMITATGRIRHSVYYSILDSEWPAVKACLEEKLSRD